MEAALAMDDVENKPGFEKFYRIPAVYYRQWIEKHGGNLHGSRILDFGCGEGLASVGLAHFCGASFVHGVDIGPDFEHCAAALAAIDPAIKIPENVRFERIAAGDTLPRDAYDIVVSWSVLEHVSADVFDAQVRLLFEALVPGGLACIQIAPLFYSPRGSHLFGLHRPWEHLSSQHDLLRQRVFSSVPDARAANDLWDCFITLNKFTADEFVRRLGAAGFLIEDSYQTTAPEEPDQGLLEAYQRRSLTLEQLLLVCRKPAP